MEPGLRSQFTRYNGRRYRMCAYKVYDADQSETLKHRHIPPEDANLWAGFAESRFYLGGTGRCTSRRETMLRIARIVADDAHGRT